MSTATTYFLHSFGRQAEKQENKYNDNLQTP